MQIIHRTPHLPFLPLLVASVAMCLSLIAPAISAPKTDRRTPAKKKASRPASAPVNLGNGILLLGEDSGMARPLPSQAASLRATNRYSAQPVARASRTDLNAALVHFCRSYLGRKLGNGQCSELAVLGLPAIGAQLDFNNLWGTPVCTYSAVGGRQYIQLGPAGVVRGNPRKANVKPGDIIQFEGVKFERRWEGGYSVHEYPHHTAVIEQVSRDGTTLKVLEQNVNGTQYVLESVMYLPDQTQGTMSISRPIPR